MICFTLTEIRLGPYKLAYVLNKCLDRFEHPAENVQRNSSPDHTFTIDPTQSSSRPPLEKEPPAFSHPLNLSPMPTLSPPPVEMPPLLNQPHWYQTDKLEATSSSVSDSSDSQTPTDRLPVIEERALPIRPKLTKHSNLDKETSTILIVDDNAINRRVSQLY